MRSPRVLGYKELVIGNGKGFELQAVDLELTNNHEDQEQIRRRRGGWTEHGGGLRSVWSRNDLLCPPFEWSFWLLSRSNSCRQNSQSPPPLGRCRVYWLPVVPCPWFTSSSLHMKKSSPNPSFWQYKSHCVYVLDGTFLYLFNIDAHLSRVSTGNPVHLKTRSCLAHPNLSPPFFYLFLIRWFRWMS